MSRLDPAHWSEAARYPRRAGYSEPTTSKEAADRIEAQGRANALRDRLRAFFDGGGTGTVHEIARLFAEQVAAIQPRFSELRKLGIIEPTGERRKNAASGASAHCWRRKIGP